MTGMPFPFYADHPARIRLWLKSSSRIYKTRLLCFESLSGMLPVDTFKIPDHILPERAFLFNSFLYLFMFKPGELLMYIFNFTGIIGVYPDPVLHPHVLFAIRHKKRFE